MGKYEHNTVKNNFDKKGRLTMLFGFHLDKIPFEHQ